MRRSWTGIAATVALLGCGGDSSGPSDPFPAVAGTYQLDGGFDGLTRSQGFFTGTLVLAQASRQQSGLDGTIAITATFGTEVITLPTSPIVSASVTPNGAAVASAGSAATDAARRGAGGLVALAARLRR